MGGSESNWSQVPVMIHGWLAMSHFARAAAFALSPAYPVLPHHIPAALRGRGHRAVHALWFSPGATPARRQHVEVAHRVHVNPFDADNANSCDCDHNFAAIGTSAVAIKPGGLLHHPRRVPQIETPDFGWLTKLMKAGEGWRAGQSAASGKRRGAQTESQIHHLNRAPYGPTVR